MISVYQRKDAIPNAFDSILSLLKQSSHANGKEEDIAWAKMQWLSFPNKTAIMKCPDYLTEEFSWIPYSSSQDQNSVKICGCDLHWQEAPHSEGYGYIY